MSASPFSLLLCTNGRADTRPALDYGVWLSETLQVPVTLLGVIETGKEAIQVKQLVDETAKKLEKANIPFAIQIDEGRGSVVIAKHACAEKSLTVFGPLGRPTWQRVLQGRSFRRVLERVCTPILYIREERLALQRMLICLGGLDYSESVMSLSLYLAKATGASLTLLHIVEPVTLQYPLSQEIDQHWQHILETDTPQGKNLRQAFELAQRTALDVEFKVRHGNPVHEIIEEIRHGKYDLTGMGSQHSTHSLRHLYMPNVTAEVAEAIDSPVLAVRQGFELVQ